MAETAAPLVRGSDTPMLDFERPVVELERKIEELVRVSGGAPELHPQIALLEARARELQQKIFAELTPWQKVQLSRHPARPYTLDFIERLGPDFIELHGDRRFADDPAVVGGFGTFAGFGPVHPSVGWMKLKSLAEGAAIASKKLWGKASPQAHLGSAN